MVQPIPNLDVVQAEADRLHNKGLDVHTMKMVLWDGHIWQVTLEATDDDCENHEYLYDLDLYGYRIDPVKEHRP